MRLIDWVFYLEHYLNKKIDNFRPLALIEEEKVRESRFEGFKEEIVGINKQLALVSSVWRDQFSLVSLLEDLSQLTPATIYFEEFSFTQPLLKIVGFSATREDLFQFKKNLESYPKITDLYFTPSSWVNQKNVEFALTAKINEQDKE